MGISAAGDQYSLVFPSLFGYECADSTINKVITVLFFPPTL
jgi:hypothetical protein